MNQRKKSLAGQELSQALVEACRDLVYISETDRAVIPLFEKENRGTPLSEFVCSQTERPDPVDVSPASIFFDRLTKDQEWHGEREQTAVRRFSKLRNLLSDNLKGLRLYRQGRVRIDLFVLGHDSEGNIAGIRTTAVET